MRGVWSGRVKVALESAREFNAAQKARGNHNGGALAPENRGAGLRKQDRFGAFAETFFSVKLPVDAGQAALRGRNRAGFFGLFFVRAGFGVRFRQGRQV
jgi:hypothetical protein